jgi:hypothetical protein
MICVSVVVRVAGVPHDDSYPAINTYLTEAIPLLESVPVLVSQVLVVGVSSVQVLVSILPVLVIPVLVSSVEVDEPVEVVPESLRDIPVLVVQV